MRISMEPGPAASARAEPENAGEKGQRHHVGVTQAAPLVADKLPGKAQQYFGERTTAHQFSRQNEKWHCHQREAIDAGEGFLQQYKQRVIFREDQRSGCGQAQRKRNGHANGEKKAG